MVQLAVLVVAMIALAVAAAAVAVSVYIQRRMVESLIAGLDLFIRVAAASSNPSGYLIADEIAHPKPPEKQQQSQVIE